MTHNDYYQMRSLRSGVTTLMSVELSPSGERGYQYQSLRRLLRAGSTQTLFPMLGRLYRPARHEYLRRLYHPRGERHRRLRIPRAPSLAPSVCHSMRGRNHALIGTRAIIVDHRYCVNTRSDSSLDLGDVIPEARVASETHDRPIRLTPLGLTTPVVEPTGR